MATHASKHGAMLWPPDDNEQSRNSCQRERPRSTKVLGRRWRKEKSVHAPQNRHIVVQQRVSWRRRFPLNPKPSGRRVHQSWKSSLSLGSEFRWSRRVQSHSLADPAGKVHFFLVRPPYIRVILHQYTNPQVMAAGKLMDTSLKKLQHRANRSLARLLPY